MTNNDMLDQLRYRRDRISELMALQVNDLARELFRAESNYVNTQIEYRERYGGLDGIVMSEWKPPAPAP